MEASYPGKRASSVAEMNYFLRFHPVYGDEILKNVIPSTHAHLKIFQPVSGPARLMSVYMGKSSSPPTDISLDRSEIPPTGLARLSI